MHLSVRRDFIPVLNVAAMSVFVLDLVVVVVVVSVEAKVDLRRTRRQIGP